MIDQALIADAKARLAALDLSAETARLAEIDDLIHSMETAVAEAQKRREEISNSLRLIAPDDRGVQVAEAMLSGVAAIDAPALATNEADLRRDRDDLVVAIREIHTRADAAKAERHRVQVDAGQRIAAELWPLCDTIHAQARQAASTLVESYVALAAIGEASRSAHPGWHALREIVPGLLQMVPQMNDAIDVPEPIIATLAGLESIAPKLAGRVLRKVPRP